MNDLQTYINNFLVTGNFTNNIDSVGNVILQSSESKDSEVFIAVSLSDYNYDNEKIKGLYDVTINTSNVSNVTEIVTVNQDLQDSYNTALAENQALKDSLAELVNIVEANPAQAEVIAQRDLIIKLRIALGEGSTESDFSTDFPYEKL